MQTALVTGSCGLVGSEMCRHLLDRGWNVVGVDNNMRRQFFGDEGSTAGVLDELKKRWNYRHVEVDIRSDSLLESWVFKPYNYDFIVHTAAQPAHDYARKHPDIDFQVNVTGTHNMLELARKHALEAPFIFTSSSKVYNTYNLDFVETETRYNCPAFPNGLPETFPIDHIGKSLFGAHKAAADIIAQEYALYFGMKVGVFRGGCLTGPNHSSVEMHGFLNYLIKCIKYDKQYTVYGYGGKQVRDNIHSEDLIEAFAAFYADPKPGVYNIGGGLHSNCSILEAIKFTEELSGKMCHVGFVADHRGYDHQWYISDTRKFQEAYPFWRQTWGIEDLIEDIYKGV